MFCANHHSVSIESIILNEYFYIIVSFLIYFRLTLNLRVFLSCHRGAGVPSWPDGGTPGHPRSLQEPLQASLYPHPFHPLSSERSSGRVSGKSMMHSSPFVGLCSRWCQFVCRGLLPGYTVDPADPIAPPLFPKHKADKSFLSRLQYTLTQPALLAQLSAWPSLLGGGASSSRPASFRLPMDGTAIYRSVTVAKSYRAPLPSGEVFQARSGLASGTRELPADGCRSAVQSTIL